LTRHWSRSHMNNWTAVVNQAGETLYFSSAAPNITGVVTTGEQSHTTLKRAQELADAAVEKHECGAGCGAWVETD
jgi:hypothetical protein